MLHIEHHQLGGLNHRPLFPMVKEAEKSKVKVLADVGPARAHFPVYRRSSSCLHMAGGRERWLCGSSHGDTHHLGDLMTSHRPHLLITSRVPAREWGRDHVWSTVIEEEEMSERSVRVKV